MFLQDVSQGVTRVGVIPLRIVPIQTDPNSHARQVKLHSIDRNNDRQTYITCLYAITTKQTIFRYLHCLGSISVACIGTYVLVRACTQP